MKPIVFDSIGQFEIQAYAERESLAARLTKPCMYSKYKEAVNPSYVFGTTWFHAMQPLRDKDIPLTETNVVDGLRNKMAQQLQLAKSPAPNDDDGDIKYYESSADICRVLQTVFLDSAHLAKVAQMIK